MDKELIQADLNLLKILHVLLEEGNVTHAADRLFVSQPAISKSLRRLRQLFDDPLFVRSANGLIATPRAEELSGRVRNAIEELGGLLKSSPFDPALAHANVRIAAPEPFVLGTIPNLAVSLVEAAPDVSLEILHLGDDHLARLAAGKLDYVIYLDKPYPKEFTKRALLTTLPRIWFREHHPLAKKRKIALADTCAYPQVAFRSPNVAMDDILAVELAMKKANLKRKVMMSTSHLLIALDVLTKTDALMLGPDYLSLLPSFNKGIRSHSVGAIAAFRHMHIKLALIQHERTANSPLHRWMGDQIARTFSRPPRHRA